MLDLSKVPSLWTLCLGPGLGKAFHQMFVQQINFANVGEKTQGMKFLMLRESDSAEKHWISSLHLMCHILSNSPWPLFSYTMDSLLSKKSCIMLCCVTGANIML